MTAAQEGWYARLLPLRGEIVADVGANVGRLSQFFWDAGARTNRVVSIEPLAENAKAIEARIKAANAGAKWTVKRCAVSARDGHLALQPLRASWGANSMVPIEGASAETIEVACRTLEGLVPDATIVKIDVEGHEYAFLSQALAAMPKVRAWALELHCVPGQPLEETLGELHARGLRLVGAGQRRGDKSGAWVDIDLDPRTTWAAIPGVSTTRDGLPAEFKMLHVVALR